MERTSEARTPAVSALWSKRPRRPPQLLAIPVGMVALAIYLTTAAPTVAMNDAARFQTAAPLLGIGHPTGYPTFILLGKLFTFVPFGDTAFRVTLMAAFFGAAAAALMFALLARLGTRAAIGAGVSLAFAFTTTFWSQANVAEVYTMHAAFILGVLYLMLLWREGSERAGLYLGGAALLYGLSLGNNAGMVLLVPSILVLLLYRRLRRISVGLFVACAALLIAGVSIYLYVPIRGFAGAWHNYGDPVNDWQDVYNLVTAARFQGLMGASPPEMLYNAGFFLWKLSEQLIHPWGFVLAAALLAGAAYGAVALVRRDRAVGLAFIMGLFVTLIYALNYRIDDIEVYYIPVYIFLFMLCGVALGELSARARTRGFAFFLMAVAPAVAALMMILNYQFNDMSDFYAEQSWAYEVLSTVPEDAVVYGKSEILSPTYFHQVEGARPDMTFRWLDGGTERKYLQQDLRSGRPVYFVNDPGYVYDYLHQDSGYSYEIRQDLIRLYPEQ